MSKRKLAALSLLILIFTISFSVRFFKIGIIPNGISPDEATIGYNAYSILKTGKDIYGENFPLFFQLFDSNVGGLTVYSLLPSVIAFGLSDFSIRVVPAALGVVATIVMYLLTRSLYPKDKYISYISSLTFALAPWSVAISRAAFGHIDIILFYLLFLLFFVLSISKNRKFIFLAALFLGLTLYIYLAGIVYLLPLLIITGVIYRKELFKNMPVLIISIAILFSIAFPALKYYYSPNARTRFTSISVFTPEITLPTSISEMDYDQANGLPLSNIIHNRRLVYLDELTGNYLKYLNLDYLFVSAKEVRYFYVNNVGLFYLIELPFFLFGLYTIAKRRTKSDQLILGLLLIGPIPAIITLGTAYPHRGLLMLLAIQLISAVGISQAFDLLHTHGKKKFSQVFIIGLTAAYMLNVIFYLHQYFVHTPLEFTSETDNGAWYSTVRDVIPFINQYGDSYQKIVFTQTQPKLVPASYFLFYNKIDPKQLQESISTPVKTNASYEAIYSKLNNIEFRPINWQEDKNLKNALLIGYQRDFPKQTPNVIGRSYLPDGSVHFLFVSTQPK